MEVVLNLLRPSKLFFETDEIYGYSSQKNVSTCHFKQLLCHLKVFWEPKNPWLENP